MERCPMPLSIEDEQTDELARRLASTTGETITTAVRTALRERLERLESQRSEERLLADVRAISRRFRQYVDRPFSSLDHGDLLYDEMGLPR
jgi:antitoxin VapB